MLVTLRKTRVFFLFKKCSLKKSFSKLRIESEFFVISCKFLDFLTIFNPKISTLKGAFLSADFRCPRSPHFLSLTLNLFFFEMLVNFLKQHVRYLKKKATQSVCKIVYNIFQL